MTSLGDFVAVTTYSANQQNQAMTEEQFTQVVEAILEGKYSWACLLILKFAGYNPLHYIPYRTYNRLIKDHKNKQESLIESKNRASLNVKTSNKIEDLGFVEPLTPNRAVTRGGNSPIYSDLFHAIRHCYSKV
jgi:hypothetical protein